MSDIESDNSSTTSFGDISVCEEIGQLIDQCHQLHEHIHNSFETLKNVTELLNNNTDIYIINNEVKYNLGELIESLHNKALNNIKEKGYSKFGNDLLQFLE
jgi:hypothetical protein